VHSPFAECLFLLLRPLPVAFACCLCLLPLPYAEAFASCRFLSLLSCSSRTCLCVRLVMACVSLAFRSFCGRAPLSCVPLTDPPPPLPMSASSVCITCLHFYLNNQPHIKDSPPMNVCHSSHLCGEYLMPRTASGPHLSAQRLCLNTA